MMAWIQLIVGGGLIVTGLLTMCVAVIGIYRFHYILNRMHAAAMLDSLGILFVILGLMVLSGFQFGTGSDYRIFLAGGSGVFPYDQQAGSIDQ